MGDKLSAVIGPYEIGRAPQDEQSRQGINHVGRVELAVDMDHQGLLRELIDNVEGAIQPPATRPVLHEIIGPGMIWAFWPETDTGAIAQPEPSLLGLFLWDFEPFAPPDRFDTLVVHMPACVVQQSGDHSIAIAPVGARQLYDVVRQPFFVGCAA